MRLRKWGIFFIIFNYMVINGCSNNDSTIIEEIQEKFPQDFQNEGILHSEIIGNGLLVFFKHQDGIGAGFFKQQSDDWEWVTGSGFAAIHPGDGLSVHHSNRKEIPLFFSYGTITNSDIFEVRSSENVAKIIQLSDGTKLWFITI